MDLSNAALASPILRSDILRPSPVVSRRTPRGPLRTPRQKTPSRSRGAFDFDDGTNGQEFDSGNGGGAAGHGHGMPAGRSSFWGAVFNTTNLLVGVGLLAYPFALRVCGWSGMVYLAIIGIICRYTGSLIGRIIKSTGGAVADYPTMGRRACGLPGAVFITFIFFVELLVAASAASIVLAGDSFADMLPSVPVSAGMWSVIFLLSTVPTVLLPDVSFLAPVSLLGFVACMFIAMGIIAIGGEQDGAKYGGLSPLAPTQTFVLDGIPFSIGLLMVGFAGHAVLGSIYLSMAEPKHYESVLNWSFGFALTIYSTTAVVGYAMYGDQTLGQITDNLPQGNPITVAMLVLLLVSMWSKFALALEPISNVTIEFADWALERMCGCSPAPVVRPHGSAAPALVEDAPTAGGYYDDGDDPEVARTELASMLTTPRASRQSPRLPARRGSVDESKHRDSVDSPPAGRGLLADSPVQSPRGAMAAPVRKGPRRRRARPRYSSACVHRLGCRWGDSDGGPLPPAEATREELQQHHQRADDMPTCRRWAWLMVVRLSLASLALLMAVTIPSFDNLLAFAGSLCSFTVSIACPPLIYAIMFHEELSPASRYAHYALSALGAVFAVVGTAASVMGPPNGDQE